MQRAEDIIATLEGQTGLLEEWMAHYISEQLARVERMPDGRDRAATKAEIADMITRLWRITCDKKARTLIYNLTSFQRATSLDQELAAAMASFIHGSGSSPADARAWLGWLQALSKLEAMLLGVWAVSQDLATSPAGVSSEAWPVVIDNESSASILEGIATVFPKFDRLDVGNGDVVDRRVRGALAKLAEVRKMLLEQVEL